MRNAANTIQLKCEKTRGAGGATQAEEYDPLTGESELVGGGARMAGQFSAAALLPGERVLITGAMDTVRDQDPTLGSMNLWCRAAQQADEAELSLS